MDVVFHRDLKRLLNRTVRLLLLSALSLSPFNVMAQTAPGENTPVVIHIKLSNDSFGASGETANLYALEDELEASVGETGEFDGHEIGAGFFTIYVYGTRPELLLAKMTSILSRGSISKGSFVEVRGNPSDKEVKRIELPLPYTLITPPRPIEK